jgi:hypothetical protein
MDWDPRGERLAIACGPAHPSSGRVALYSTSCQMVVNANFMGMMSQGDQDYAAAVTDVKFHGHYDRGGLLALRSGGNEIDTVPLIYSD